MHRIFYSLYLWIDRHQKLASWLGVLFLAVCLFLGSRIQFEEDITRLIPKSDVNNETAKVLKTLKFADKITVIIQSDKQELSAAADAFLSKLEEKKAEISSVEGQLDAENLGNTLLFVQQNAALFLDSSDYRTLKKRMAKDSLAQIVEGNLKSLLSPTSLFSNSLTMEDPFGITFMALKKLQKIGLSSDFVLENGYLYAKDKQHLFLFLNPIYGGSETEHNTVLADKLQQIKFEIEQEYGPNLTIKYHGAALIAVANAHQIKHDILTTVAISVSLLLVILMLYYRRFSLPIILFIPTLFGALLAVAILYFLKDTLSAISLSIAAILMGVTIDYALHILTHYKHAANVEELFKEVTRPLLMSSSTTAIAFLCLLFVQSEALVDLGIFASVAVMASAIFSLILVPHLYRPERTISNNQNWIDRIAHFPFEKSKVLIALSILLIVVSGFTYSRVYFNENISELNYVPQEIQEVEKELEKISNLTSKSLYLVNYGYDIDKVLEDAHRLNKELVASNALSVISIGGLILSKEEQEAKIKQWNQFWKEVNVQELQQSLSLEGVKRGFSSDAYRAFFEHLGNTPKGIELQDYLAHLNLSDFVSQKEDLYTVTTLVKVANEEAWRNRFENRDHILMVDRQHLNETFLGNLKNDFSRLVNLSFFAVLFILWLFFRRVELVLISAIPILITGWVTAGIMGLFHIPLNIFSTIVCTLIFGHGVDFSIFMTSALQKEYTTGKDETPIYRTSIILAVITTILAIGALIFAQHPALKSISSVSLIGVFAAVIITFIFYPILFRGILIARVKKGRSPFRLGNFLSSFVSFVYFGLGGLLFSFLSVLISYLPGKNMVLGLRRFMSKYMKSVLDTNVYLKKTKIDNPTNEGFSKPAVIIANHTSFLDILALGMLHPKSVFLVSDWVYNSPVFGRGVRNSGFYPVSKGVEGSLEHLRPMVEEGYSIVVFPEGTRSVDNTVKRFHKGAFYLAEYFNLDLVPVLIHGGAEALPKNDFIIRNYGLTLKILPRIAASDSQFGSDFVSKSKGISKYFKEEYKQLRKELEPKDYFREVVKENYVLKDQDVVKRVERNLDKTENIAATLNSKIGEKAKILHWGNDLGELDLYLILQASQRKIFSYIPNEEDRAIARNNFLVQTRTIQYLDAWPMKGEAEVLLLSAQAELPKGWENLCETLIRYNEDGTV